MLLVAQLSLAGTTAGLALNAHQARPALWLVYLLAGISAFLSGIDYPARSSSIPRLVEASALPATYALRILIFQTAGAVGPALAGVIIAELELGAAYLADAFTYVLSLSTIAVMRPLPPHEGGTRPSWRSMREGFGFIRRKQGLQGIFLIDVIAMVFGMPRALFPELGISVFGGDARTVGYLFAAPGVGAMIAGITSGWVGRVRRAGRATIAAVVVWGLGTIVFGLTTALPLALAALALARAGDIISAVFRSTILQMTTPDQLRGRVSAVQNIVVAGGRRVSGTPRRAWWQPPTERRSPPGRVACSPCSVPSSSVGPCPDSGIGPRSRNVAPMTHDHDAG